MKNFCKHQNSNRAGTRSSLPQRALQSILVVYRAAIRQRSIFTLLLLLLVIPLAACSSNTQSTGIAPGSVSALYEERGQAQLTPQAALQALKDGNKRFYEGRATHNGQDTNRLKSVAAGAQPIALILACSDTRVPTELIFDQGIGDIFVVRVAGNVTGAQTLGSIEYAVKELNVPLVLVLGHTDCGAIKAAWQGKTLSSNLTTLLGPLSPVVLSVKSAQPQHADKDSSTGQNLAAEENVKQAIQNILQLPQVMMDELDGKVKIAGGVYDVQNGQVRFF